MSQTRVFLLDDHKIIRDGLKSILASNNQFKVCGEMGDPAKFMDDLPKIAMDILLLDISFPSMSGFHVLKKVKLMRPDIRVLMLSMHNDTEHMQKALSLGASGYIAKDCDAAELISALETVSSGKEITSTPVCLNDKSASPQRDILTVRELEVLKLLSRGLSSKEIGASLDISTRTVETHRLNIMKKLGTNNSAETISVAVRLSLL
jgi:DNA-binding NarL/FixJ family response regulator